MLVGPHSAHSAVASRKLGAPGCLGISARRASTGPPAWHLRTALLTPGRVTRPPGKARCHGKMVFNHIGMYGT